MTGGYVRLLQPHIQSRQLVKWGGGGGGGEGGVSGPVIVHRQSALLPHLNAIEYLNKFLMRIFSKSTIIGRIHKYMCDRSVTIIFKV